MAIVEAIGNPGPKGDEIIGDITPDRRLGGPNGIGFGWSNVSVYKLGFIYRTNDRWVWRFGWNYNAAQIPPEETLINLIMPSIMRHRITAGASFVLPNRGEVTLGYMHGFNETHTDYNTDFFGTTARVYGSGDILEITYSSRF